MDQWEEAEIKYLSLGGNQRLKFFLLDFELPENSPPCSKYFLYAMDYYRRNLQYELAGGEKSTLVKPVRPSAFIGMETMVQVENNVSINGVPTKKEEPKTFIGKVENFFENIGEGINKGYKLTEDTVIRAGVSEKMDQLGKNTKNAFESFGKETKNFFDGVIYI